MFCMHSSLLTFEQAAVLAFGGFYTNIVHHQISHISNPLSAIFCCDVTKSAAKRRIVFFLCKCLSLALDDTLTILSILFTLKMLNVYVYIIMHIELLRVPL